MVEKLPWRSPRRSRLDLLKLPICLLLDHKVEGIKNTYQMQTLVEVGEGKFELRVECYRCGLLITMIKQEVIHRRKKDSDR